MTSKVTLEVVTEEQYDEMVRGMATWQRISDSVQRVIYMRSRAGSQWNNGNDLDFIASATDEELTAVQISGDGDDGWDSESVSLSRDEVLNMQETYDKHYVLVEFLEEQQKAKYAKQMADARRKQYEELKSEFESAGA